MGNKYDSRIDTCEHINKVSSYCNIFAEEMIKRGHIHDSSKLFPPEKDVFDEYTPKLKEISYGSDEYKECLNNMQIALNHHYENNDHHPEYFTLRYKQRDGNGTPVYEGLSGMDLFQLSEMFCDWFAACQRNDEGGASIDTKILNSISINQERFGYSDELKMILINTANKYLEKLDRR